MTQEEERLRDPTLIVYYSDYQRYKNKAKCRKCGDIITSTHVHDFVFCKCQSIFVDGGNNYWRCGGTSDDFERLYEIL